MPKFDEAFDDEEDTTAGRKFWNTVTAPNYEVTYSASNQDWLQEVTRRLDRIISLLEKILYRG